MHCRYCGALITEEDIFCNTCGKEKFNIENSNKIQAPIKRIGYSDKINDPRFEKYVKNSNKAASIFSIALAIIAIVGFTIAGERNLDNLSNPQSMYIGFGIGGMFLVIALLQVMGRKRNYTWDGIVEDKTITKQKTRNKAEDSSNRYDEYLLYEIKIRSDSGKKYITSARDDATQYNYYEIGDKVRHHGGINSYEKYDKTGDTIVFCNACATLCDIDEDECFRCKCPLLK